MIMIMTVNHVYCMGLSIYISIYPSIHLSIYLSVKATVIMMMTVKTAFSAAQTTVTGMKMLGLQTIAANNYSGENHRKH